MVGSSVLSYVCDGPHDRGREARVAVGGDQQVLAGDLVPGVLPERVAQRRRLGHRHPRRRLLVRRRGADEHVLPDPAGEQLDVGGDVVGQEGAELRHGVELAVTDGGVDRGGVGGVRDQRLDLVGQVAGAALAAVHHGDLMAAGHRQPHAGGADHATAADEEDASGSHPGILAPGLSARQAVEEIDPATRPGCAYSVTRRILSSFVPGSIRPSVLRGRHPQRPVGGDDGVADPAVVLGEVGLGLAGLRTRPAVRRTGTGLAGRRRTRSTG